MSKSNLIGMEKKRRRGREKKCAFRLFLVLQSSGFCLYSGTALLESFSDAVVCSCAAGATLELSAALVAGASSSDSASARNFSASRAAIQPEPVVVSRCSM